MASSGPWLFHAGRFTAFRQTVLPSTVSAATSPPLRGDEDVGSVAGRAAANGSGELDLPTLFAVCDAEGVHPPASVADHHAIADDQRVCVHLARAAHLPCGLPGLDVERVKVLVVRGREDVGWLAATPLASASKCANQARLPDAKWKAETPSLGSGLLCAVPELGAMTRDLPRASGEFNHEKIPTWAFHEMLGARIVGAFVEPVRALLPWKVDQPVVLVTSTGTPGSEIDLGDLGERRGNLDDGGGGRRRPDLHVRRVLRGRPAGICRRRRAGRAREEQQRRSQ